MELEEFPKKEYQLQYPCTRTGSEALIKSVISCVHVSCHSTADSTILGKFAISTQPDIQVLKKELFYDMGGNNFSRIPDSCCPEREFTFIINSDLNEITYTSIAIDLFNSALLSKCPKW